MPAALPLINAEVTADAPASSMGRVAHAPSGGRVGEGNAILAALAASDARLLEPVEPVRLASRYALFDAGEPLKHLYFPTSAVVSFVQVDARGAMPEIAHVGAEGLVGVMALFGAQRAHHRAVVQIGGGACRVSVHAARRAFASSPAFQAAALRFAQLLMRQLAQSVVCKLSHTVEQQLCQRLLVYAERAQGAPLEMTHEQIAEALGSRRQGVTEAARRLQAQRVISYSRGRISILDRSALERCACACYCIVRDAYRRATAAAPLP